MKIRPHKSQHEKAEDLPLITESAKVTLVENMDHNRHSEIEERIVSMLDTSESRIMNEYEDIDWEKVYEFVKDDKKRTAIKNLQDRYERAYPSLLKVRFEAEEEFDFVAGQYITVRYDDYARPYSISSSPNCDYVEICVRRVPGGKLSPLLCDMLEENDKITVRGPNGEFFLRDKSKHDMVFLATGTGVAPLKSMIDYAFEEGYDVYGDGKRDIWLFLGASWEDDLPYRDEFRGLSEERDNFHFVPCVTREKYLTDWNGEENYIQHTLVKYIDEGFLSNIPLNKEVMDYVGEEPKHDIGSRLNPNEMEVYSCGISAMVKSVVDLIEKLGVPEECIDSEAYG